MNTLRLASLFLSLLLAQSCAGAQSVPEPPPCIMEAASFHGVNSWVLRAIAWQESKNQYAIVVRNSNQSIDVGRGGINSIHFSDLQRFGIAPEHLLDGCVNAYVSAWLLAKHVKRFGNTWQAVGAYHSTTPVHNARYARDIHAILRSWRVL